MKNQSKMKKNALLNAVRPLIENLEQRISLSAAIEYYGGYLFVVGTESPDNISVVRTQTSVKASVNGLVKTYPSANVTSIEVYAEGGYDTVSINTALLSQSTLHGGDSLSDKLLLIGTTDQDNVSISGTEASLSEPGITSIYDGFEQISVDLRGGGDDVTIEDQTSVNIIRNQVFDALTLEGSAIVDIAPGSSSVVTLTSLPQILQTGYIDVNDNAILLDYTNFPTTIDAFAEMKSLISSGLALMGGNNVGIGAEDVDAQAEPGTFLSVVNNAAVGETGFVELPYYENIPFKSVIVTYTWFGDANLDGMVDGQDTALVDTGFTSGGQLSSWVFGDFDLSGETTGSDYALLDTGLISQTGTASSIFTAAPRQVRLTKLNDYEGTLSWLPPTTGNPDRYYIWASVDDGSYELFGMTPGDETNYNFFSPYDGNVQFKITAQMDSLISTAKDALKLKDGTTNQYEVAEFDFDLAVSDLNIEHYSNTSVWLTWEDHLTNETGWLVVWTPINQDGTLGESTTALLPADTVSYHISGLQPGLQYQYDVVPIHPDFPVGNNIDNTRNFGFDIIYPPFRGTLLDNPPVPSPGVTQVYPYHPNQVKTTWSPMMVDPYSLQNVPKKGGLGNETATLKLSGLPEHAAVHISFAMLAGGGLNGANPVTGQHGALFFSVDSSPCNITSEHHADDGTWGNYSAERDIASDMWIVDLYLEDYSSTMTISVRGQGFDENYKWRFWETNVSTIVPRVSITSLNSVTEGDDQTLQYELTREGFGSEVVGLQAGVEWLRESTAEQGGDVQGGYYTSNLPTHFPFAPGETSQTIGALVLDDFEVEGTETLLVRPEVGRSSGYTGYAVPTDYNGNISYATGQIIDDEMQSNVWLSDFRDGNEENEVSYQFKINRTGDISRPLNVKIVETAYGWNPVSGYDGDFLLTAGTYTIHAGASFAYVSGLVFNDGIPEPTDAVNIRVVPNHNGRDFYIADTTETRVNIFDNDNYGGNGGGDGDSDGDGLTDAQEFAIGTNPLDADSDADDLLDGWEVEWDLNPVDDDENNDNIIDGLNDADGDGLSNVQEQDLGTSPTSTDTDQDLLPDGWETEEGFDPTNSDENEDGIIDGENDGDNDGLDNEGEYINDTDPNDYDTDDDLLPDGFEVESGLDPHDPDENGNGIIDSKDDDDGDGLNNLDESNNDSDPNDTDTDDDGMTDKQEADQGSNPSDATDNGVAPPDDMKGKFRLTIGDNSGSHSEQWAMNVGDRRHISPDYGVVGYGDYFFKAGKTYPVTIDHLGSNIAYADFDWQSNIAPTPGTTPLPYFIVDKNDPKLIQPSGYGGDNKDFVTGKKASFVVPLLDVDVDSNNDGGYTPPTDNEEEDRLEQDSTKGNGLALIWVISIMTMSRILQTLMESPD